jgi:hypothetical protein
MTAPTPVPSPDQRPGIWQSAADGIDKALGSRAGSGFFCEGQMARRSLFGFVNLSMAALVASGLVALGGVAGSRAAMAEGYQPGQFLTLDLAKAVLSPNLLGPPSQFEPVAVEAKADTPPPRARTAQTPRRRTLAARQHRNPLDAQASVPRRHSQGPRIQAWPCRSGGICGWQSGQ